MEMVDKFDKKRLPLNKITERYEQIPGEYRQSMHVWIQNDKGEFLIQKRSPLKRAFPGYWSITGGGVDSGESTLDTVFRECKEELGITVENSKLEFILSLKRKYVFVDVYLLRQNVNLEDIVMQEEEVSDVKWATIEDIKTMFANNEFASNILIYFDTFTQLINPEY